MGDEDEYQLFESLSDAYDLMLKHCEGLWKLLNIQYTLREQKWSQISPNIPKAFQQPLRGDVVRNALRQWVNTCDLNEMLQLLIEWKAFMEDKLMSGDHIQ